MEEVEPLLPFNLRVLDARELYNSLASYQSLHIRKGNDKNLYVCVRSIGYETDWDYKFNVSQEEADEIISLGYARLW